MDIAYKAEYPAKELSNFAAHRFMFDDVPCESMEGLVQALKIESFAIQMYVCTLVGIHAKRYGEKYNEVWHGTQVLWWNGEAYDRHSQEYQDLLDRMFAALAENKEFKEALLATGNEPITHSIWSKDPHYTVLTEQEFCERLMKIRTRLQQQI